jgi:hypothetical protein
MRIEQQSHRYGNGLRRKSSGRGSSKSWGIGPTTRV